MQEAQRERIADFLHAGASVKTIKNVTKASTATIYRVMKKLVNWSRYSEEVPKVMHTKHPASIMVLAAVGSDGQKMPLHLTLRPASRSTQMSTSRP